MSSSPWWFWGRRWNLCTGFWWSAGWSTELLNLCTGFWWSAGWSTELFVMGASLTWWEGDQCGCQTYDHVWREKKWEKKNDETMKFWSQPVVDILQYSGQTCKSPSPLTSVRPQLRGAGVVLPRQGRPWFHCASFLSTHHISGCLHLWWLYCHVFLAFDSFWQIANILDSRPSFFESDMFWEV